MIVVTPRCLSAAKSASTGYGPSSTSSTTLAVRSARQGCTKTLAGCSSVHTPSAPSKAQKTKEMARTRRLGLYMIVPHPAEWHGLRAPRCLSARSPVRVAPGPVTAPCLRRVRIKTDCNVPATVDAQRVPDRPEACGDAGLPADGQQVPIASHFDADVSGECPDWAWARCGRAAHTSCNLPLDTPRYHSRIRARSA